MLTTDQVFALAPDSSSAAAARKLAHPRNWRNLGRSDAALWGECQGSALYQVRIDLSGPAAKCSCPSRKVPCKHSLGLMLLASAEPQQFPAGEAPSWVAEWLATRAERAVGREQKQRRVTTPDAEAQARRAAQRLDRVRDGIDALDLWMNDLVRHGLAAVDAMGSSPWETQAARLVDAQAPALASRIRGLSFLPRSSPRWAEDLLAELGRIALLTEAFHRLDDLDPPLQADVRQLVGWTLKEEDVVAAGDFVEDDWLITGQWTEEDERFNMQRTWLHGARSRRVAMVLQFAAGSAPFEETFVPGTHFEAVLAFWPGALPLRALVHERKSEAAPWEERLPGSENFAAFLDDVAQTLARQPWLGRFPCSIRDVVPLLLHEDTWTLVDRDRIAIPLAGSDIWQLLAISGGHPIDVVAEWDGRVLRPLFASAPGDRMTAWARGLR
jgi:hypothetical protein